MSLRLLIKSFVDSVESPNVVGFPSFPQQAVLLPHLLYRYYLQVMNGVTRLSKVDSDRGGGLVLALLRHGSPMPPKPLHQGLPCLANVLGMGRAARSPLPTCDTIDHICGCAGEIAPYFDLFPRRIARYSLHDFSFLP